MIEIRAEQEGFCLVLEGRLLLRHSSTQPAFSVARGDASVTMVRGNFDISDTPTAERIALYAAIDGHSIILSDSLGPCVQLQFADHSLTVEALATGYDRLHIHFHREPGEHIWGGGEQMSYLALDGRRFPMWTSEPGVGRDKTTALTQTMDADGMAGGDYWTTNYPQPTVLTSRWIAIHCAETCYSVIDATADDALTFELWRHAATFEFFSADEPLALVSALSDRFGRQPPLPDWAIGGAIVGLKDGDRSFERLDRFVAAGAAVSGIWCEDWAGVRETSFGRRLFWDWRRDRQRFRDLPARISALQARGIRFLGYANPYLAVDGILYPEARDLGHFCLKQDSDEPYLVDFGEFDCGVLDFTRAETRDWFAEKILGQEMLDIGMAGWMADFGEYLPTDVRLADGSDPMEAHNRWPVLWAEVNAQAVTSRDKTGEAVFFMRAGFSGVQAHCPLLWAGDQSVDFTRHDGIGTVITGALSAGLLGNAYSHSDCGGYTSLHGNVRTVELMQRWCEMAAFAPVMRSHEGNRPDDNWQYDSSNELLTCFARWSRAHAHLAPYVRHLCDEALAHGWPAQRAMFLHYPDDATLATVQDQYCYGSDLIVAPVIEEGARSRLVRLPGDRPWRHVWTGADYAPGVHEVPAPIGQPPLFYDPASDHAALFAALPAAMAL